MTEIFKMPDIGEGMAEGDIANWLIKVGDVVKADDPIAEVQNDKLMQEILSPYSGTVTHLFVEAGTTVEVGDSLVEFDGDGSGAPSEKAKAVAPKEKSTNEVEQKAQATTAEQAVSPAIVEKTQVLAMPSVRQYAHANGVDLSQISGTGRRGHITLDDVKSYLSGGGSTVSAPSNLTEASAEKESPIPAKKNAGPAFLSGQAGDITEQMTPTRKAIANAMANQHTNIPSVTNFDQVEVTKLVEHRKIFKEQAAEKDIKLTYLAYVTKALAATAKKFPELNASVKGTEIIYHAAVNVGIAVNAPTGLYVPVIHQAESKSILSIAEEISTLAEAVRNGTIKPAQMQGSTITISNIGSARGNWFTPIINGSDVVILGLGSIVKEPIVNEEGQLAVGQNMKLSMTYDHRLIDGMLGQTALNYLKSLLADPAFMLMEV